MKNIYKENIILHEITLEDLKEEAKNLLGRNLKDNEITEVVKLLQISFNETRNLIFSATFENLKLK
jgi:hypothetical protein